MNLSTFSFMFVFFLIHLVKEVIHSQSWERYSPIFSSQMFIVLTFLTFIFIFNSIGMYYCAWFEVDIQFYFVHMDNGLLDSSFFFLVVCRASSAVYQVPIQPWTCFWSNYLAVWVYLSISAPMPHCLNCSSFIRNLGIC